MASPETSNEAGEGVSIASLDDPQLEAVFLHLSPAER